MPAMVAWHGDKGDPGMEIIKGVQHNAWLAVLYGVPGIGKSTLAALAPKPLFLDLEGGLARIDCDKTPRINDYAELIDALKFAYKSDYTTIVLDTLDGVEELIRKHVCAAGGQKSIEAFRYGKGYTLMTEKFQELLNTFELFKAINKNVLLIGHEIIKSFSPPDGDAYDRYILKMNQKLASVLVGRADAVFFAQYEALLKTDRTHEDRLRAIGTGRRILRTQEAPAWIAKNRMRLEPTIDMDAAIFNLLKGE
jgi:hypothetical protein